MTASKLHFIGVVAIADPVRVEVPAAVQECIDAGIDVKVVTGDISGTAREIARQIGLWDDSQDGANSIITGPVSYTHLGYLGSVASSVNLQVLFILTGCDLNFVFHKDTKNSPI